MTPESGINNSNPIDDPQVRESILINSSFLLEQRTLEVINQSYKDQPVLLALDYDGTVGDNLSMAITNQINFLAGDQPHCYSGGESNEILSLWKNYYGIYYSKYIETISRQIIEHPVRTDFLSTYKKFTLNPNIFTIIISSGIKEAISISLQYKGISRISIIGSEVSRLKDLRIGLPILIIGQNQKAEIVEMFRKYGNIENVIAVGDGESDVEMFKCANHSIQIGNNPSLREISKYQAENWIQTSSIINDLTK